MKHVIDFILMTIGVVMYLFIFGDGSLDISNFTETLIKLLPAILTGYALRFIANKWLFKRKQL